MTKTFTQTNLKKLSKQNALEQGDNSDQSFYKTIKPSLDELYREPSDETIAKILKHVKKR
ncbi:hypothetical protein [Pedobacter sp. SL55]|uniref:hypothetical protein n=1 Tax=Pedobacter sp. SL55 TaxID=2995161 RepID=UPI0022717B72|nr:hypothetical protein [Pedobacter sp. SL55]WAC41138.1 hypothetical protein OVA16_01830 [Pedobacter sp. SL55]